MPLYFTGDYSAPADFLWNTAMPSTVTPGFYSDTGGFFVAMNADWTAAAPTGGGGGGGGGGPPGGGGGGAPGGNGAGVPISFPRTAAIHNGAANVALRCLASAACAGQIVLQNARLRGAHQASAASGRGGVGGA